MRGFFKLVLANLTAIFIVIAGFFVFFIAFLVLSSISTTPEVKSDSILTLDLNTKIIDSPTEDQEDFLSFGNDEKPVLLYDILPVSYTHL